MSDIENRLSEAKEKGDSKNLEAKLESLKKERELYEKTISLIKDKYSYLNFHKAVTSPFLFFVLSLLLSQLGDKFYKISSFEIYLPFIFTVSIGFLFYGIIIFSRTLTLIQDISSKSNKEAGFDIAKLPRLFKDAIAEHEEESKEKTREKVSIKFINQVPLACKVSEEFELNFKVHLSQGKIIKGVDVWFFLPDQITLIKPSEDLSWRQDEDYKSPNKKTVKVSIGILSIGPHIPGVLKIKAPANPGTYTIYYRIYGEGYQGIKKMIEIIVS